MSNVLDKIKELFENEIGLNSSTMNDGEWKKNINQRMEVCCITNEKEYYNILISSEQEFQEFVELLIVPETWFFRGINSIDQIVDYFIEKVIPSKRKTPVHILSIPCSTGEEPYSLAIALHKAHISDQFYEIDAYDISKRSLAIAELGFYGSNSFRGQNIDFRDRYFNSTEQGYMIKDSIKERIRFGYANIIDPNFLVDKPKYSIIMCNNLLIYMTKNAQNYILSIFEKLLTPDGLLFASPAETELLRRYGFVSTRYEKSFAFKLPQSEPTPLEEIVDISELTKDYIEYDEKTSYDLGKLPQMSPIVEREKQQRRVDKALKEAQKLADEGNYEKATELCQKFLKEHGVNTDIFYLLGLMNHALSNEQDAEEYFMKSVYLNPNHHEALVYLSLLADKNGDIQKADLFRTRAKRAATKNVAEKR